MNNEAYEPMGEDIGSPRLAGSTRREGDLFVLTAGGKDIWEERDEFHFVHLPARGDWLLEARLRSMTMADLYTKAGLMARTGKGEGARHVMVVAFGDNRPRNCNNGGIEMQCRAKDDGLCRAIYPPQPLATPPDFPVYFPDVWLRLSRRGDQVKGAFSRNGRDWKTYGAVVVDWPEEVLAGLALTSHHPDELVTAAFHVAAWPGKAGAVL